LRFSNFWRAAILIPNVTSVLAIAVIFSSLYGRDFGLINYVLNIFGVDKINWMVPLHYETGNWGRVNKGLGAFDLLIASDVLYERSHPAQLSGFIQAHAAEGAEVLIVDPNRGNRNAFHRDMAHMGFSVTELIMNEPLRDLSAYRGRLLHYKRDC
jgi:hypothetical protein